MSLYHERSSEGGVSGLDLFSLPLSEVSCLISKKLSYHPIAPLSEKTTSIDFNINSSEDYLDIGGCVLHLEASTLHETPTTDGAVPATKK
jgi:hypothetical protein